MEMNGKETILLVPGGKDPTTTLDLFIDTEHGPSASTGQNELVTKLGGPVTDMYTQTKDVHWQGNYFGYGTEANMQGSPIPEVNMNTRKLLYAYPVDDKGNPKSLEPGKGFRVFLMFDFIYWAEDPGNKLGCVAPASSAAYVDKKVTVPLFRTPMQLLHNWPKRWQFYVITASVAVVVGLLVLVAGRAPLRAATAALGLKRCETPH